MSNKYTEKRKASNERYKKKIRKVEVTLTPEEKEELEKKAKDSKNSMNGYIRTALGLKATPFTEEEETENGRD